MIESDKSMSTRVVFADEDYSRVSSPGPRFWLRTQIIGF